MRRYFALSGTSLLWYEAEKAPVPIDLVCLQFAVIGTQLDFERFVFTVATPLRTLQLRAPSQASINEWADAIMKMQSSEKFAKLLPQGGGLVSRAHARASFASTAGHHYHGCG